MLSAEGRPNVPDIIIFMTDGEANQPSNNNPCQYTVNAGSTVKASGVTIFTIGYGVGGAVCGTDTGSWRNIYASSMLATLATGPTNDDSPGGCGTNENKDGDHYFCEAWSGDLEPVFRAVAAATLKYSRLLW